MEGNNVSGYFNKPQRICSTELDPARRHNPTFQGSPESIIVMSIEKTKNILVEPNLVLGCSIRF